MDSRRTSIPSILAIAACLLVPVASAQDVPTVLGLDGTVFRLHQGVAGDLLGEGTVVDPLNPVLALDVRRADGSSERLLVPGTESSDLESSASMVFEDKTGTVYLAWETLFNGQHPLLQLTSFDGIEWSELIEITGNVFANKGVPELLVQRETVRLFDSPENEHRTTLHLSWWEESVNVSRKLHAMIILDDGRYLGWAPVIDLGNYYLEGLEVDGTALVPMPVPGLENALTLQAGRNLHTVVSAFVNPHTHRLITVEIEAISQIISSIADAIRAQIIVIGLEAATPFELAELARAEVLAQGTAFHEAARQYLADQVATTVEQSEVEFSPAGLNSISELIRAQIIVIGSRIGPGGLANPRQSQIIAVGETATGGEPQHYYQISVVSDREAPEVGGPAELMLSESGEKVIVTWEAEGHVFYRESLAEGWSEASSIELTEDLDRETVYQMLAVRVRAD